ncbi:RNA-binding domain-containing protein [Lactifluus volemus]|nr:RNA-binding domain-containing protein [Lactifluus volemus]
MSRLIVKNLPSYITPPLLKEHFSQSNGPAGTITDVKIALKQDGTARRFGFIGFKTDKEALNAKAWYDKTFIDSTRVRVEVIDGVKDAPLPRPNKRRHLVSSSAEQSATSTRKKSVDTESPATTIKRENAKFEEFMEVMQSKPKRAVSWVDQADPFSSSSKKGKTPATQTLPILPEIKTQGYLTDMEWMQQRMKGGIEDIASPEVCFDQSDDEEQEEKISGDQLPTEETILSTGRLFVRNLTFTCTEEELRGLFQSFGLVSQIHIPIDPLTKESKGLAFVTYVQSQDALTALRTLDGKSFQGRLLHILGAIDRNSNASAESSNKLKTLKEQRKEKRKVVAGKEFNWSMLYMNSDAVLSSVADRMNIPKSDILDPESSDAAVKLALAETHIIQETKTYLESHGVVLAAFSERGRSETIILVKNIPYGTTAEQLNEMFAAHGELQRVLVPPAGTLAVIEFVHADEARKAFRALAYRRLGNSIIYLEKGPLGMFQPTPSTSVVNGILPIAIENPDAENGANLDITGGKTLFVKNLAFATSSQRFTQAFHHLPGFAFARVQTKQDPKRLGARLSMGFGFVEFRTTEAAQKALKGMHGHILDGHMLSVRFAGRGAEEQEEKKGEKEKARTTKMLVKNVPFEATWKDIQQLFGAYGQLKSVRLPKRFDRRSRGFAFLEFVTRHEAENAFNALRHTHLLGRHLVLEWAEEGDVNIDELRRKAGVGFGDGSDMPGKKRKLVLDEDRDGGEDDV